MSAHSGSSMALWSANGTFSRMFLVQSLSNAAQPPSLHWKVIIHFRPRWKHSSRFCRIVGGDFAQRQQHHRGVVHVRVPFVVEFKDPAARLDLARDSCECQSPRKRISRSISHSAALFQRGMIFRNAGFVQADGDDGRVPDRREARLDAHVVVGFVLELLQFVRGADDLRMVVGIARAP